MNTEHEIIDVREITSFLVSKWKIILLYMTMFALAGWVVSSMPDENEGKYHGKTFIQIGQYKTGEGMDFVASVELLTHRFDHLRIVRANFNKRLPVDGLVAVSARGPKKNVEKTISSVTKTVLNYLRGIEEAISSNGMVIIEKSEVIQPLTLKPASKERDKKLIIFSFLVLGFVAAVIVLLVTRMRKVAKYQGL